MFCAIPPPLGFPSDFRTFEMLRAFGVGRVIFLVCLCVSVPGPFSRWYIARLALDYFALSSTSDAAPLSLLLAFSVPAVLACSRLPLAYLYVQICRYLIRRVRV